MEIPIEAEVTTMALDRPRPENAQVTPAQAKIEAVAALTLSAYQKAGQLALTEEETVRLQADFPDEAFRPGAAGKEDLIYIEHASLRERLNQVVGPGQWAIVPRSRWAEDYEYYNSKSRMKEQATRVYVEAMLIIRGCFVAESIGDMTYYKHNQATNYGDAVEGAKSSALRRCAKELGIGLQAWKKEFCESWWKRRNGPQSSALVHKNVPEAKKTQTPTQTPKSPHGTKLDLNAWLANCKAKLLVRLGEETQIATEYARKHGLILETENLEDAETQKLFPSVDWSKSLEDNQLSVKNDFDSLVSKIKVFAQGGEPTDYIDPNDEVDGSDAQWRSFPMPFGKHAGKKLADLDKPYLFGLWANFKVETEYNGKPKKPESIEIDRIFRQMLDLAGQHYDFHEP